MKRFAILFLGFTLFLFSSCEKDEITRINKITVFRDSINQITVYETDTIEVELSFGGGQFSSFVFDEDLWGEVVPIVHMDFGEGFQALPYTFYTADSSFATFNCWHDQVTCVVFFENDNLPSIDPPIPVKIAYTSIRVQEL
jgi:hypothetical protein